MILADTGFFYGLLDSDDAWHTRCRDAAAALDEGLVTTWPVLTEAMHLVMPQATLPRGICRWSRVQRCRD